MIQNLYQIRLVVIGAQDLQDVSTMGKMDAFAKIYYDNMDYRTSVIHDSGKNPSMACILFLIHRLELLSVFLWSL